MQSSLILEEIVHIITRMLLSVKIIVSVLQVVFKIFGLCIVVLIFFSRFSKGRRLIGPQGWSGSSG
jgi:hypothetical protein